VLLSVVEGAGSTRIGQEFGRLTRKNRIFSPYCAYIRRMPLSFTPKTDFVLRPYQEAALERWSLAGSRGVVVLPTGSGKTAVGAAALVRSATRTLILVPTIDLLSQWETAIKRITGAEREHVKTGFPGDDGGEQLALFAWEPPDVLIATYAGAARNLQHLHHFGLLIFDEVHHLPAPVFRRIAEDSPAIWRLGLTATPERYDGAQADLEQLVGATVYRKGVDDLAEGYLAPHQITLVSVDLDPDERLRYDSGWKAYIGYVRRSRLRMPAGYQELIKRAGRDGGARKALQGHREAREVAMSARQKIRTVEDIVEHHAGDSILIFCQHVDLAARLGEALDYPVATHETPKPERARLLEAFRNGSAPVLIATSILDEGVDVPDASIGILVSGTGQARQFVQRLGRLIRPRPGKEARLYEIVTRDTLEERTSQRRRKGTRDRSA